VLNLSLSESSERFRQDFRGWLKQNPPPARANDSSLEVFQSIGRAWQAKLASGGWLGVHWPPEFGGRGLSLADEAIIQEELVRVSAPQVLGLFGLTMVGPVLISHGSEEQKQKFLPKILSGEEIWCQGFSETGAGSDLAAVKTRAAVVDGGFKLSGHKIWTSFAHLADWCFVLCRTSESGKKHEGLSYLLVDMKSAGIETRPLQQMSGDKEFNEVYFDDVFVPHQNLVGQMGDGWRIAVSTLMFERVVLTFARQLQSEVALRDLLQESFLSLEDSTEVAQEKSKHLGSDGRRDLAECVVNACATRALAYSHLLQYAEGASPGPEGSLDKLLWSESFQHLCKVGLRLLGTSAALGETNESGGAAVHRYLYSRGRTIAAGTSEIQRSIIAERILNLPRLKYSA
jgi:alkylation response protein AidB-like acyl-CoA dehydrogenase